MQVPSASESLKRPKYNHAQSCDPHNSFRPSAETGSPNAGHFDVEPLTPIPAAFNAAVMAGRTSRRTAAATNDIAPHGCGN
jgi:hypothetical protein